VAGSAAIGRRLRRASTGGGGGAVGRSREWRNTLLRLVRLVRRCGGRWLSSRLVDCVPGVRGRAPLTAWPHVVGALVHQRAAVRHVVHVVHVLQRAGVPLGGARALARRASVGVVCVPVHQRTAARHGAQELRRAAVPRLVLVLLLELWWAVVRHGVHVLERLRAVVPRVVLVLLLVLQSAAVRRLVVSASSGLRLVRTAVRRLVVVPVTGGLCIVYLVCAVVLLLRDRKSCVCSGVVPVTGGLCTCCVWSSSAHSVTARRASARAQVAAVLQWPLRLVLVPVLVLQRGAVRKLVVSVSSGLRLVRRCGGWLVNISVTCALWTWRAWSCPVRRVTPVVQVLELQRAAVIQCALRLVLVLVLQWVAVRQLVFVVLKRASSAVLLVCVFVPLPSPCVRTPFTCSLTESSGAPSGARATARRRPRDWWTVYLLCAARARARARAPARAFQPGGARPRAPVHHCVAVVGVLLLSAPQATLGACGRDLWATVPLPVLPQSAARGAWSGRFPGFLGCGSPSVAQARAPAGDGARPALVLRATAPGGTCFAGDGARPAVVLAFLST